MQRDAAYSHKSAVFGCTYIESRRNFTQEVRLLLDVYEVVLELNLMGICLIALRGR